VLSLFFMPTHPPHTATQPPHAPGASTPARPWHRRPKTVQCPILVRPSTRNAHHPTPQALASPPENRAVPVSPRSGHEKRTLGDPGGTS